MHSVSFFSLLVVPLHIRIPFLWKLFTRQSMNIIVCLRHFIYTRFIYLIHRFRSSGNNLWELLINSSEIFSFLSELLFSLNDISQWQLIFAHNEVKFEIKQKKHRRRVRLFNLRHEIRKFSCAVNYIETLSFAPNTLAYEGRCVLCVGNHNHLSPPKENYKLRWQSNDATKKEEEERKKKSNEYFVGPHLNIEVSFSLIRNMMIWRFFYSTPHCTQRATPKSAFWEWKKYRQMLNRREIRRQTKKRKKIYSFSLPENTKSAPLRSKKYIHTVYACMIRIIYTNREEYLLTLQLCPFVKSESRPNCRW